MCSGIFKAARSLNPNVTTTVNDFPNGCVYGLWSGLLQQMPAAASHHPTNDQASHISCCRMMTRRWDRRRWQTASVIEAQQCRRRRTDPHPSLASDHIAAMLRRSPTAPTFTFAQ
jgi:hypothetical protein